MAFKHGKSASVVYGAYNISSYLTEASSSTSIETAETTTLGSAAKSYIAGLNDGTLSFSGLYDGTTNAIQDIFQAVVTADSTPAVTFAHSGLTNGAACELGSVKTTSLDVSAPVSDVVTLSGEFQVTGGLRAGILLEGSTALSATTNGTAIDNTTSTTTGATANLHVTANTRSTTSVIKVQHSADNVTFADLITFTTVGISTVTSEAASVSGTVNRYLRVQTTLTAGTGSITLTLSIARRN